MYAGLPASLQSKAFQNRTVGIIENGTWGPTAGRTMKGILETMKILPLWSRW